MLQHFLVFDYSLACSLTLNEPFTFARYALTGSPRDQNVRLKWRFYTGFLSPVQHGFNTRSIVHTYRARPGSTFRDETALVVYYTYIYIAYEQRIREVEHGSFTPLIMSSTGGLGHAATCIYKRLASLLSDKLDQPYCKTMGWLRCSLTFSLVKSSIMCIRGARSSCGQT